jgi:hypothetical protein
MTKRWAWWAWVWMLCGQAACAAPEGLSATETRWLQGVWPVLLWARDSGLPLDIVVQPQPMPEAPPLAMAFVGGRCKLVLSMRGNAEVEGTLQRIAPDLLDVTLELMAAHELGHCKRWLSGGWHGVPAGFVARAPATLDPQARQAWAEMQAVRREEAYADLVGLAWIQRHHPQHYTRLQGWLLGERSNTPLAGSHHDTRAWLRLVPQGGALAAGSLFDAALRHWEAGLALSE